MVDSPLRTDLFAGSRALVTGGGTGMGLAFATAFAAHGAQVAIASRNADLISEMGIPSRNTGLVPQTDD